MTVLLNLYYLEIKNGDISIMSENCLFCKIIKGEIPSKKIYEDDDAARI